MILKLPDIFTFSNFKDKNLVGCFQENQLTGSDHNSRNTFTIGLDRTSHLWTNSLRNKQTVERIAQLALLMANRWRHQQTCGGVGVEVVLPPDIISSVMSRPPWLGSHILICGEITGKSQTNGSKQKHTKCCCHTPVCVLSVWLVPTVEAELAVEVEPVAAERDSSWQVWWRLTLSTAVSQGNRQLLDQKRESGLNAKIRDSQLYWEGGTHMQSILTPKNTFPGENGV